MSSSDEVIFFNSDALNEDFFTDIVEKKLKISSDKFKINLVLITPATGKNENYTSVVYCIKIKIRLIETNEFQLVNVFMKALLSTMPEMKEFSVFPRERFMYEDMLASLEKIWFEKTGEEIQFGPQGIKFATDPYEILVMDDLKAAKYEMVDRMEGASVDETRLILSKLAKFHATSALRYQKEGVVKNYFDRQASENAVDLQSSFILGMMRMYDEVVKAIRKYGDSDVYADKMEKLNTEKMIKMYIVDDDPLQCGFKALNHGDLWVNNIMFKFNEKREAIDVIMLDFQLSFWGSPLIDILTYLIISIKDDIKVEHFDGFIEYYHAELSDALKRIGYEERIPNLDEIYIDIMEKRLIIAACISYLFFAKMSSNEEITLEMMLQETDEKILSDMYERIYKNDALERAIKSWLPFLDKCGFFDSLE